MSGWLSGFTPGTTFQSPLSLNSLGQTQTPSSYSSTTGTGGSVYGNPSTGNIQAELGQMMTMLMAMIQSASGQQSLPAGQSLTTVPSAGGLSPMSLGGAGGGLPAAGGMPGLSVAGTIGGVPIPTMNGQLGAMGFAAIDMGLNNTVGIIQNSLSSVRLSI